MTHTEENVKWREKFGVMEGGREWSDDAPTSQRMPRILRTKGKTGKKLLLRISRRTNPMDIWLCTRLLVLLRNTQLLS